MEKYSKHLEVLVTERTQDLMLEKQKTDRLLYSTTDSRTVQLHQRLMELISVKFLS